MPSTKGQIYQYSKTPQILELARSGETAPNIARIIGVNIQRVHVVCRSHGVRLRPAVRRIADHHDRIVAMRANGMTWRQVSDSTGFCHDALVRYFERVGETSIKIRTRKEWRPEEIETLRELWGRSRLETISERLGRAPHTVRQKARRMNLTGGNHAN